MIISNLNIGSVDQNVQANFLAENGYGQLRFYNDKFQYYNTETSKWIDIQFTEGNSYILQIIPQAMKSISVSYNFSKNHYLLNWEEPNDTIIDGQAAVIIDKIIIVRKLGSMPESINDGITVNTIIRSQFGNYKNTSYEDKSFTPNIGETWYYKLFPHATSGFYNESDINGDSDTVRDHALYGFRIDQSESDPDSMITYIGDNKNYTAAHMDYEADTFDYGDWKDIWFIKNLKPCVLNTDGSVRFYLDPDNYTKTIDGESSNIESSDFNGYVMVGIPKVYYKCTTISDDVTEYRFSDHKIDEDYVCWSHINAQGNEIDYCYISPYSVNYSNTSIKANSGLTGSSGINSNSFLSTLKTTLNSKSHQWDGFVFSDYCLLTLLLMLIGKSTDVQTVFGKGGGGSSRQNGLENSKGLFYGDNTNTNLKVFGIEHLWGDGDIVTFGANCVDGKYVCKMTYDGSGIATSGEYNSTGTEYYSTNLNAPSGTGSFISKYYFTDKGIFPKSVSTGSATTYFCDALYSGNNIFSFGGNSLNSTACGIFMQCYHIAFGTDSNMTQRLSCKPL